MCPETQAICEKKFPNNDFGLGIPCSNLAHHFTPFLFGENICHHTKVNKALAIALFCLCLRVGLRVGWQRQMCAMCVSIKIFVRGLFLIKLFLSVGIEYGVRPSTSCLNYLFKVRPLVVSTVANRVTDNVLWV